MSIKKRNVKIEIIMFVCFMFLFLKALPSVGSGNAAKQPLTSYVQDTDEQANSNLLVVEYATGNDTLLNKEVGGFYLPTPTVPPTPTPTVTPIPADTPEATVKVADIVGKKYILEELLQVSYLKEHLYIVNATTKMTESDFDVEYFISKDLALSEPENDGPQILIFHTHASEGFADSRAGVQEDTVVGVGTRLAELLEKKYGYQVLHDTTVFDKKNGKDNRNYAYNDALDYLEELLEAYPSIEVVIDLHRDAGEKRVATVNGKPTAKVMLFNGLCRNTQGKLTYLPNENLKDNLAISFQMKLIGDELYPGLMNRIFLKDYRYNMHLKERYLLIELGTQKNTVEEAMNAMEPLADVLHQVLDK